MMTSWAIGLRFGIALLVLTVGVALRLVHHAPDPGLTVWHIINDPPLGEPDLGWTVWRWGLAFIGSILVGRTIMGMFAGRFAADIIAAFSIVGAFALGQPFAGLVIVVMQTGGEALERLAAGRASRAVRDLEAAAPRTAHLLDGDTATDVSVDIIKIGDRLLVRPGEMIPCDSVVIDGRSHIDTATLTGEPIPQVASAGTSLLSGSLNLDGPLTVRAIAVAAESQYSRIVELVRTAQESKAPIQRLADRYAIWFTPFTVIACLVTWLVTKDPVRLLAVLVVATPCPLILAVPVAMIAGLNRAARRHLVIRNGGALESLSRVTVAVFDKTGTLTIGKPRVVDTVTAPGFESATMLQLAAAVEHGSGHLLARPLVDAAVHAKLDTLTATDMVETPGAGITGRVGKTQVTVGSLSYIGLKHPDAEEALTALAGNKPGLRAFVAIDGQAAGYVEYADVVRPGMRAFVDRLHGLGIRRVLLLSGDATANTLAIGTAVGIDEAYGDLLPSDKVSTVQSLMRTGEPTMMVGDGTNDAPALSAATVGVALSAGGSGISAEAADVVILGDDPVRVAEGIEIGRRTMRIARQSIWGGLGLSAIGMGFAAAGLLPPAAGAMAQEVIDVAVIVNALRAAK